MQLCTSVHWNNMIRLLGAQGQKQQDPAVAARGWDHYIGATQPWLLSAQGPGDQDQTGMRPDCDVC